MRGCERAEGGGGCLGQSLCVECGVLGVGGVRGIMWNSPRFVEVDVMRLWACDVLGMLGMLCMTSPEGWCMYTIWHHVCAAPTRGVWVHKGTLVLGALGEWACMEMCECVVCML